MSARAAVRGRKAANVIRLAVRASSIVATSRASASRWVLRCPGKRRRSSSAIPLANCAIPPVISNPLQKRGGLLESDAGSRQQAGVRLMGGKVHREHVLVHLARGITY